MFQLLFLHSLCFALQIVEIESFGYSAPIVKMSHFEDMFARGCIIVSEFTEWREEIN